MRSGEQGMEGMSQMTRLIARLLLAPILIIAAAILVKGYAQPGDGFSAGVVASLGIMLQYLAFGREEVERRLPVRGIVRLSFAGLLLALTVAIVPLFLGDPILTHYPPPGSDVIYLGTLELITAVAFDFGIFLLVFGYGTGVLSLVLRLLYDPAPEEAEDAGPGLEEEIEEGRTL